MTCSVTLHKTLFETDVRRNKIIDAQNRYVQVTRSKYLTQSTEMSFTQGMKREKSVLPYFTNAHGFNGIIYRARLIIVILFSILLLLTGCSKNPLTDPATLNLYQQFFEQNILNHDYQVQLATDSGTDITSRYAGYTFRMLENSLLNGPITVTKGSQAFLGSWSSNDDYSKLVITLPPSPVEFLFIAREWRFTKKDLSVMELAPWGSTDPKVLHMLRL